MAERKQVATWRIIVAFILDFFTAFFVLGFLVASFTGGRTAEGFSLEGWPALLLFGLIAAYFIVGRMSGGTLWARLLGAVRHRA
ncbi:MAG: hypothetical protein GC150_11455 [Rhizobiales bacterium]|nr:hypothetical protein [Hyphomicrobiales bacterium]